MSVATDTHITILEMLEVVFSMHSLLRLYNEGHGQWLPSRVSCEMVAGNDASMTAEESPLLGTIT